MQESKGCMIFFQNNFAVLIFPWMCTIRGEKCQWCRRYQPSEKLQQLLGNASPFMTVAACCTRYTGTFNVDKIEKPFHHSLDDVFYRDEASESSQEGSYLHVANVFLENWVVSLTSSDIILTHRDKRFTSNERQRFPENRYRGMRKIGGWFG